MMAMFLIRIEIRTKRDYSDVHKKINLISTNNLINPLENFWVIQSTLDASQIRDLLLFNIDAKDSLFVVKIDIDDWASWNIHEKSASWLNQNTEAT